MKSELLIETISASDANIVTEMNSKGSKDVWLQGVFMQAEIKNRNGRVYSLQEMTNNVNQAQLLIKEHGGLFGELDHPQTITINMDRISHVITELKMEGNNVIGKAKLLDTPMGKIAKTLAESGVRYGVSSRGAGTVSEDGSVSGFSLVTVDLVAQPSAPSAMPNTIYESLQEHNKGEILTLSESIKSDPKAQKYLQQEIDEFIKKLFS